MNRKCQTCARNAVCSLDRNALWYCVDHDFQNYIPNKEDKMGNYIKTVAISKAEYDELLQAQKDLEMLKKSEAVRLVLSGKYTPKELDSAYKNLRERVRQQEYTHQLDLSEITSLRRRIEMYEEAKE